jgi:hypothetical protein
VLVCRRIRSTSLGAELDRSATRADLRDGTWCLAFAARLRAGLRVRTWSGHAVNEPPAFGLEARTRQAGSRTARSRLRVLERSGLRTAASGQRVLWYLARHWSSRVFGLGWIRTSSREEQPTSVGGESFDGGRRSRALEPNRGTSVFRGGLGDRRRWKRTRWLAATVILCSGASGWETGRFRQLNDHQVAESSSVVQWTHWKGGRVEGHLGFLASRRTA